MATATLTPDQLTAVADLFRALAEPTRLRLLQELGRGPKSVGDLVTALDAKQANISKQLGILHDAGLVERTRTGNRVEYTLVDSLTHDLCHLVCKKVKTTARRRAALLS